jgi:hypothetical protein
MPEQDVGDALHRAALDDRKYAQLVSVVEHGSEISTELHIGAADRSRDQRHRVGVQPAWWRPNRTEKSLSDFR